MKRSISILLCIALIFSSFSLCFATPVDWDSSDSQHLTEIRNSLSSGGTIYNTVNAINSNVLLLNSNLVQLMSWLDPANGGGTSALLNQILNALTYTDTGGLVKSWLSDIWQKNALTETNTYNVTPNGLGTKQLTTPVWTGTGWSLGSTATDWYTGIQFGLNNIISMIAYDDNYLWPILYRGYNDQQTYIAWDTLNNSTFTPTSQINGFYTWLSKIQNPVARLSYVLASDERIEAQELAAANEQAVVDEFIDSTGDGSVPTNSFSDVSGLSSGVTSNLSTDASPAQIWDIFNSNHGTWFSQETANQLDTTTRTRGSEFETPLLDQQMEEIYKSLGGGK